MDIKTLNEPVNFLEFDCDLDFRIDIEEIAKMLPPWKTVIKEAKVIEADGLSKLQLKFLISATTPQEVQIWRKNLEEISGVTYAIRSTEKCLGWYVDFKQRLKCQRNTRCSRMYNEAVRNRTRNTNCPSSITITIRSVKKYPRGNKDTRPNAEMPCEIVFIATHNHGVKSADALRFRSVSDDTKRKLLELYENGYTPATAREAIKIDLQLNQGSDTMLSDRKYYPDYNYCYHLYKAEFRKKYKPVELNSDGKHFLKERLEEFNRKTGSDCAKMVFHNGGYVICICPPLLKQVHSDIESASEIAFMASSEMLDSDGNKIFVLFTDSDCGGLPIGIIITTMETENIITGFKLLQQIVGDDIFRGHHSGPKIFLTADSSVEQSAVRNVWTKSTCLLCQFHVLHDVKQWLVKSKSGISQDLGNEFYQQFKSIMYAETADECVEKYTIAKSAAFDYGNYCKYLDTYWNRKELWASCYRNMSASNFCETAMNLIKGKVFSGLKNFNAIQMVDFILTNFVSYYQQSLLDIARDRLRKTVSDKMEKPAPEGLLARIQVIGNDVVFVPSQTVSDLFYMVNTNVLTCTCSPGNNGRMCKHIEWACQKSDCSINNAELQDDDERVCNINSDNLLPSVTSLSNKSAIAEGKKIIGEITKKFDEFLEDSPCEALACLRLMNKNLDKLKTTPELVSACAGFGCGSELQLENREDILPVRPTVPRHRKTTALFSRNGKISGRSKRSKVSAKKGLVLSKLIKASNKEVVIPEKPNFRIKLLGL